MIVTSIERISTDSSENQANGYSYFPVIAADGTRILFQSNASNLVPGDTNGAVDLFIKDLVTGAVTRISTDSSGTQANNSSGRATFSNDGTKVLFQSGASNLVPGDTNATDDFFVKNLLTGAVTRINTDSSGNQANGDTATAIFSSDGSKVVFSSYATNLVPGDTNGAVDIFIKDLATGVTTRVSTDSSGAQANGHSSSQVFSPDGSKVLFYSSASNLVSGDTNGAGDLFIKDLATGVTTRVNTDSSGNQANGGTDVFAFSPDGTKVVFSSSASNLVPGDTNGRADLFIKDLITGETSRIVSMGSLSNGLYSYGGFVYTLNFSPDGTKVIFVAEGGNTHSGNTISDIFIKDLITGEIALVSSDVFGNPGSGQSGNPVFSPDGAKILFQSDSTILVPGDTNGYSDFFIKDLVTGETSRVNTDAESNQANNNSIFSSAFSPDGNHIVFASLASNLVPGDTNNAGDLFLVTLGPGAAGSHGTDTLIGGAENETFRALGGNDLVYAGLGDDDVYAGAGHDRVWGEFGNDSIHGGSGDDILYGDEGDDTLYGDDGIDLLRGGEDSDFLHGGAGNDFVYGDSGNDTLRGDDGNDRLYGGTGDDDARGGAGNDVVYGDDGNDRLEGDDGDDTLYGGNGIDALRGENGNDALYGGNENDDLRGGSGNDTLRGENGDDALYGDSGNDVLYGGSGIDKMTGGTGADGFAFDVASLSSDRDTVRDFNTSEGDYLKLDGILVGFDPVSSAIADFVRLTVSGGNTVVAVDTNGATDGHSWQNIARLDGVTGLNVEDLFNTGKLLVV